MDKRWDMQNKLKKSIAELHRVEEREYLEAMIESHANTLDLKDLLKENLIDKLYDRQVFFKGIDSSYYYEGMYEFTSKEIVKLK